MTATFIVLAALKRFTDAAARSFGDPAIAFPRGSFPPADEVEGRTRLDSHDGAHALSETKLETTGGSRVSHRFGSGDISPTAATLASTTASTTADRLMGTRRRSRRPVALAIGLAVAAAVTAVLLVFLDRRLRTRRIADLPNVLPPLDALEKVMFRLIGAGFGLLTLALFTGFVFVTNLFTQNLVQKTALSLIAWMLFGVLLIGRIRFGWRGRSAVQWTLSGFGVLAVAYFGVKFVLEDMLGRHWG